MEIDALPKKYQKQVLEKIRKEVRAEQPKPPKYRNVKTEVDGRIFDSIAEARRYEELKLLCEAREIIGFACQVSFPLHASRYIVDFLIMDYAGRVWAEDVKGFETPVFKIKKKEFEQLYPWIELRIVKRKACEK